MIQETFPWGEGGGYFSQIGTFAPTTKTIQNKLKNIGKNIKITELPTHACLDPFQA